MRDLGDYISGWALVTSLAAIFGLFCGVLVLRVLLAVFDDGLT